MRITELNISEFGGLKNVRITPDEKLNIIYGENESGKSTVLLFIKFMLYGLGRKAVSNTERERSISWEGHVSAGSMSFFYSGKNYRIERRYVDGGRESKTLRCLDDGREITTEKSYGEYLFGVPKEVFESSACVGQMRSADINKEKTSASIQNMLTSADENVDTAKILNGLNSVRKSYLHKSKNGGSLFERDKKIGEMRQRLEEAREAAVSIDSVSQKLASAKADMEIVSRDLEATDCLLTQINKIEILKRFEKLRAKQTLLKETKAKREELCENTLKTDFFPDNRFLAELKLAEDSYSEIEALLGKKRASFDGEAAPDYDGELAEIGERIENDGGSDSILKTIEEKNKALKKQANTTMMLWIVSAVAALLGAVTLALGHIWGALLFAFVPIAVAVTLIGAKKKKKVYEELKTVTAPYSFTPENFAAKAHEAIIALSKKRAYLARVATANAELTELQKAFDKNAARLEMLIKKTDPSALPRLDSASAEYARIESFLRAYEELKTEEDALARFIVSEKNELVNYDEEQVRQEVTVDIDEVTPLAVSEAERRKKYLTYQKSALEQKLDKFNSDLINLKARAEDPLPISDGLAELEKMQRKEEEFYSALTLAMEAIEEAGQVMSGNVIPAISSYAGEIMGRISNDKYTNLRSTSSFELSLDSEGFGIRSDFLSGGTRDAAYIALRMALFMRVYGEELPPLILDEALCQFDERRAKQMLIILSSIAQEGKQILLFTSHKREEAICRENSLEHNLINL